MKRKIKAIYIDTIDENVKTMVFRELRAFFQEKQLETTGNIDDVTPDGTKVFLSTKSIISKAQKMIKDNLTLADISDYLKDSVHQETVKNHEIGVFHFVLVPGDFDQEDSGVVYFLKNVNSFMFLQGISVECIPFNKEDTVYEIRDVILKKIEDNFTF